VERRTAIIRPRSKSQSKLAVAGFLISGTPVNVVASGIAMQFGAKPFFSDVSVKFGRGNRYGLIGRWRSNLIERARP
jgi:hypothetical protein